MYCYKRGNKRIWSNWHPLHFLQFVIVPLFKKQYLNYVIGEFLKGQMNLSLSGVNVLWYKDKWYAPVGCKSKSGIWWPYNGEGDTLIFEANEETYYLSWDQSAYQSVSGKRSYIEQFKHPYKPIALMGFFWYHLKPMKKPLYEEFLDYGINHPDSLIAIENLGGIPFSNVLKKVDDNPYRKFLFNFVHNLDKRTIGEYSKSLDGVPT